MNSKMGVMVLEHEYAHAVTHFNLEQNPDDYKMQHGRYEIEAQGIAYTACKFLGIDSSASSSMYIYSWGKENGIDELEKSLKTIVKSSTKIIESFKRFYILIIFIPKSSLILIYIMKKLLQLIKGIKKFRFKE